MACGSHWSGVIEVSDLGSVALWNQEPVSLPTALPTGVITVYNFVFVGFQGGLAELQTSDSSTWFAAKSCHTLSFRTIVDVCCGIGGISSGLWGLNGSTVLSVDKSQLATDTVQDNGGTVLTGDIANELVQLRIHQAAAASDIAITLTAGLPGQPFLGSHATPGSNGRSVLQQVLLLGWRMRVAGIILECVPGVAGYRELSACLEEFAFRAGFQVVGVPLELSSSWASHRSRQWYCLVPSALPPLHLPPMPDKSPLLVVQDIIPELPFWPESAEEELSWTKAETALLLNRRYGGNQRILAWNAQAPTITHSCGNELQACPCGCREFGLSESRLLAGGSQSVGVYSMVKGSLRFLHPSEAGLLNTLSPDFRFLRGARAGLCLVGNISAPLHAHWIFLQLQTWAATALEDEIPVDKLRSVESFLSNLLCQRSDRWFVASLQNRLPVAISFSQDWKLPIGECPWTAGQAAQCFEGAMLAPASAHCFQNYNCQLSLSNFLALANAYCQRVDRAVQRIREHAMPGVHCLPSGFASFLLEAQHAPASFLGEILSHCHSPYRLVLPFVVDQHWACLCLFVHSDGSADAVYFDGVPDRVTLQAACLASALASAAALSIRSFNQCNWFLQGSQQSCGEIAIWHVCANAVGFGPQVHVLALHALDGPACDGHTTGTGDLSADQYATLRKLLLSKGVPAGKVGQRIQDAIKKLGAGPIAAALAHKLAWSQLKSIASKPDSWFRWLSTEELSEHIESKANEQFGTSVPSGKSKKRKEPVVKASTPVQVDPSKLLLAPGSFVNADGTALPQLAFEEVCSGACGIAFCSSGQAMPFIATGQHLSVDCLGLVCVTVLSPEQCGSMPVVAVHFPAVYGPTGEAVLIRGSLLQLGDEPVQLAQSRIDDTDQLDTITCRFTVYRDEFTVAWEDFLKSPVRVLVQGTPGLTLCKDAQCTQCCGRFHAAVEEADCIDRLLLDVWGRQWSKLEGGRAMPEDAQVFACLVRVPASALRHLHLLQVRGFYAEPRATCGTGPHAGYAVVWLPDSDYNKALHVVRTCQQAVAITRLGRRYGIRVRDSDEQTVFQTLRPGCDFTKVKVTAHYRLHPLPVGCQRKHLATLLKSWKWTAKPLQPARGDSEGAAWIVGAAEEPPAPAIPCGGSFVLVRKVKDATPAATPAGLTASGRTLRRIIYDDEDSAAPDPWAGGRDPWSAARPPPGLPCPSAPAGSGTQSKLGQLREELSKDVHDLVQQHISASSKDVNDHAGANDARLAKLESGFVELRQQNEKFEGWFQNLGQQVQQSVHHVEQVQQTVVAQQNDIAQVRAEVTRQAEAIPATVQAAVSSLSVDLGAQLQQQFQKQSSQLEALLSKKQRSE
ncbi:hypothetical protein AK812_SmicGene3030 [Symbiodinium microadriaticum]|uniref:Uncharacterized protein n=1 Tax=Symbiodinium microadriaticum TaxID=2951 RepID=A0A1Q9EZU5_SYMMI|nr:hypothetical protein AK812_SmicGene3030 [Symbiodinium microadriaticum]